MLRRHFLLSALGSTILLPVGHSAIAALTGEAPSGRSPRLVVVFLRGAIDGLSVVVPYGDPDYYRARNSIAIPSPGLDGGGLDLDGYFALHPALAPLWPRWQAGQLAFIHAAGSPDPTRSHFDAQDYMESGTPGRKSTADGWLNRLLSILPGGGNALSVGAVMPRALAGPQPVAVLASGPSATRPTPLDRPRVAAAFDELYAGNGKMSQAYRESRHSRQEMMAALSRDDLETEMQRASNGAASASVFAEDAGRLARLMRSDPRLRLAFLGVGGWDTHANQGAGRGQLASHLQPLASGLATLAQGLGPALDETVVVVMSEFGRTVRENGNGGTDHGHGNVMWLLGGGVVGGKVHGRWPELGAGALHEGRDLAVTTDFRDVLATLAERHLRLKDSDLATLFPGFKPNRLPLIRT
ncbi:MAG: DUF1501 domain-containing protein [Betaproteobacteria bacterium]|nr:DUF1501 domain-containing protein [Betaproteobacteria bacterium]